MVFVRLRRPGFPGRPAPDGRPFPPGTWGRRAPRSGPRPLGANPRARHVALRLGRVFSYSGLLLLAVAGRLFPPPRRDVLCAGSVPVDTLNRPYESAVAVNERRRMIGVALPIAFPAPEDRLAFAIASVPVPAVRTRLTAPSRRDGNCVYASLGALSGQYSPKYRQSGQGQFPVQPGLAVAALALGRAHHVSDVLPFHRHRCGPDGVQVRYGVLVELALTCRYSATLGQGVHRH